MSFRLSPFEPHVPVGLQSTWDQHPIYMCKDEKHERFPWKLSKGTTEMHAGASQPRQH